MLPNDTPGDHGNYRKAPISAPSVNFFLGGGLAFATAGGFGLAGAAGLATCLTTAFGGAFAVGFAFAGAD